MVHPGPVYECGFFVSCGHKQQTTRNEELHGLRQHLHFFRPARMRIWPTHEGREVSKRSQRQNPVACWCLSRSHVVGIVPPRARRGVLVRDEAHLNDTGDPSNSQGVTKHRVNHRREHQGLSVSTKRPPSYNDAKIFCELH